VDQPRLLGPPWFEAPPRKANPRVKDQAVGLARSAVRRARERALTANPATMAGPRPQASGHVSHPLRTIEVVPRGSLPAPAPAHGTRARYNLKRAPCRCPSCCQANTRYIRSYRAQAQAGPTIPLPRPGVVDVDVKSRVL
jgi:hypothetical protein